MINYYELYRDDKTIIKSKKIELLFNKINDLFESGKVKWDLEKPQKVIDFIEEHCRHIKGPLIGKLIKLELFQKSFITLLYGVIDKEKDKRYFKEAFMVVGRKNGKSFLISCLGLYDFLLNPGAEVIVAATDYQQAGMVYETCVEMANQNPHIKDMITKKRSELRIKDGVGKLFKISGDSRNQDGYNPSSILFDEVHNQPNEKLYNVLKSSLGAQAEPLFINITTAGFVRDSIYDVLYKKSENILENKEEEMGGFLPLIYEIDKKEDYDKEQEWIKANPNLGVSNQVEFLRQELADTKLSESKLNNYLTKFMTIPRSAETAFIHAEDMRRECSGTSTYEEFRGQPVIIGLDISKVEDLTSVTFLFKKDKGDKIYIKNEVFMTLGMIQKGVEQNIPYDIWLKNGYINTVKGDVIDYREIAEFIFNKVKEYDFKVIKIGFDKYEGALLMEHLNSFGLYGEVLPQSIMYLSEPTKVLKKYLSVGWVNYNDCPVVEWTFSNVRIWDDNKGNVRPNKDTDKKLKNDPFISTLNAFRMYLIESEKARIERQHMERYLKENKEVL